MLLIVYSLMLKIQENQLFKEVKYNHHNPQGSQVLCQQHFAHQEIQAKEDSCYNDSINV